MTSRFKFVDVRSAEEISPHTPAWERLSNESGTDNVFFSPNFLIPNLQLSVKNNFLLIFVYQTYDEKPDKLVAFCAYTLLTPSVARPFLTLSYYRNEYNFSSSPLLHRDNPKEALAQLVNYIRASKHPWRYIYLRKHLTLINDKHSEITDCIGRGTPFHILKQASRAVLHNTHSFESFLKHLPKKRMKDYTRRKRKLSNQGHIDCILHRSSSSPENLARRFMQIEQASWKGENGSAISCNKSSESFFVEVTNRLAKQNDMYFVELRLNDTPIAMSANFVHGKTLFAFKIAYDPKYSDFSPGILVMMETTRLFLESDKLELADACNTENSFIEKYWLSQHALVRVGIPTQHILSKIYFLLISMQKKLASRLNLFARSTS